MKRTCLAPTAKKGAPDRNEFATAQLRQELVILSDDGHAELFLLDTAGCQADGLNQEPGCLIETRHVHRRVHVGFSIVFRRQNRPLERLDPTSRCLPPLADTLLRYHANSSSNAFASLRSGVSKPSVNHP